MTLLNLGHPFAYEMECLTRLFFPGEKLEVKTEGDPHGADTLVTRASREADGHWELAVDSNLGGQGRSSTGFLAPGMGEQDAEWALGRILFRELSAITGARPPWGILTGVRPARLFRTLERQFGSADSAQNILERRCLVLPEKADLTREIASREGALLEKAAPDGFSLYISIPFCPTRCLYCSFVSQDIKGVAKLVPDYVRLLCEEIRATGRLAEKLGLRLQTVYMGGGTPTTLNVAQLEEIMDTVAKSFNFSHLLEYTVEAGRPDTITAEKLAVLRRWGADRVSINPQTMDDALLAAIGRGHTAQQVCQGFALAREAGFPSVNMDLIAGLPGETEAGFESTMDQVLTMDPENITIHTLTVKRSSRLRDDENAYNQGDLDVSRLLAYSHRRLTGAGYAPYYLYRQKGTVQNLENIGYAKPGREGLYNVLIMEEVQTILAVGAGAVTKLYRPGERLQRVFNFKFPYEYISRFGELLVRKQDVENFYKEQL